MDNKPPKEVQALSNEEIRRRLEEGLEPGEDALFNNPNRFGRPKPVQPSVESYQPPRHVVVPTALLDETRKILLPTTERLEQPRQLGMRKIALLSGFFGLVAGGVWRLLVLQSPHVEPRPPRIPTPVVTAPRVPPYAPSIVAPSAPTAAQVAPPKITKPRRPKPAETKPSPPPVDPDSEFLNPSL